MCIRVNVRILLRLHNGVLELNQLHESSVGKSAKRCCNVHYEM